MFSRFFIERPIFANVIAIMTMLVGVVTLVGLPIERYPDITAEHLELTMVMKNHGQTPAFDMRGWSMMVISEFSPLPEGIVREGEAEMENEGDRTVLFPGGERRGATLDDRGGGRRCGSARVARDGCAWRPPRDES